MHVQDLRVCYFGTYRANYSRNQVMMESLRRSGIEVVECHEALWHGIEDRAQATRGGWLKPAFWWRVLRAYGRLLHRYVGVGSYDIMIVGYPGHFDVFLARLLTWLRRKPLVWDVLMSINLIARERQLDRSGWVGRATVDIIGHLEALACRLPDRLLIITPQYVAWYNEIYGIEAERFRLVPLGADERLFSFEANGSDDSPNSDGFFHAVYYGNFVHSHGTEYIVEAARLLADEQSIQFELIGRGGERDSVRDLARRYGLTNVAFPGFLEDDELVRRLRRADVCLASFGLTPHSLITVHNKVFELLALARPMIIGQSPAMSQHFTHREHVYYCKREDAAALAEAVRTVKGDQALLDRMARAGHEYFQAHFSMDKLALQLEQHLRELVSTAH